MVWVDKRDLRGPRGWQGISVVTAFVGRTGRLLLGMSDGSSIDAGQAQGAQGLPGTGAVPADAAVAGYAGTSGTSLLKTILSKLFPNAWTPEMYGAVGDNVANDHDAFQAALNGSGGRAIHLDGSKTYYIAGADLMVAFDSQEIYGHGCTIRSDDWVGVFQTFKKRTVFEGINFTGGYKSITVGNPLGGITTRVGHDAVIRNCTLTNGLNFVDIRYADRVRVLNCKTTGLKGHAVTFWGGNSGEGNDQYIPNGTYGVFGGEVTGCDFESSVKLSGGEVTAGVWTSHASGVHVHHNRINKMTDVGVDFEGSDNCIADHNIITDCANAGLSTFFSSTNCLFEANTVTTTSAVDVRASENPGPHRAGVVLHGDGPTSGIKFKNNTFTHSSSSRLVALFDAGQFPYGGARHDLIEFDGNTVRGGYLNFVRCTTPRVRSNNLIDSGIVLFGTVYAKIKNNDITTGSRSPANAIVVDAYSYDERGQGTEMMFNTVNRGAGTTGSAGIFFGNATAGWGELFATVKGNMTKNGTAFAAPDSTAVVAENGTLAA